MKQSVTTVVVFLLVACVSTTTPPVPPTEALRGTASWYGQEFAGRTTANGEIFDPMQLTAAHRTLPFGTVVDVKNAKSGQIVRVRINDRGPYISDRVIDLSYAAAQKIGLIEPGTGEVEMALIRLGKGDREPPAPYIVTVPEVTPLNQPAAVPPAPSVAAVPVVVDTVEVIEEHQGVETRRQVSADGKRIENVPVTGKPLPEPAHASAAALDASARRSRSTPSPSSSSRFLVQVGAFAQETNARLLQNQLSHLGEKAYIDHAQLFRVRIGPFPTRDEAIRMRARLETAGLSAIVVTQ